MRLLFLAHRFPYPPHKGEKIRSLNVLRYLALRHDLYLGCLVDDPADLRYMEDVRALVRGLLWERVRLGLRKCFGPLAILTGRSVTVTCFYSGRLQRRIDDLIESVGIDAVYCSSSPMAEYVFRSRHADRLRKAVCVMDLIDVDSYKWHQYAQKSGPWTTWIFRLEARLLAAYERRIASEFDRVLVVSDQEIGYFSGDRPANLMVMSNGVDLEYFRPATKAFDSGVRRLVFTGVMDYRPNADGVRWFVERIYPAIRSAVPKVHFFIVGNRPTAAVRRLGLRPGVTVTGFVADIRDHLALASVCVVPLRVARGVQNKVLEAMAMGRPLVVTPVAFEGIRALPGSDLVVAQDEAAFATAVIELLRDDSLAARIAGNARICAETAYSWSANLRVLDEIFAEE